MAAHPLRLVGAVYGFTAVSPAYLGSALALIAPLAFGAVLDLTNPPG